MSSRRRAYGVFILAAALAATCFVTPLSAQNFVPNPDFEYYAYCPYICDTDGEMTCEPWWSYTSANYFSAVCNDTILIGCGVPVNFKGYQQPHSGNAYAGGYQLTTNEGGREYLRVPLTEPLEAGVCYDASMYVNLSNLHCGIDHMGMIFTEGPIPDVYGMLPQVDYQGGFLSDTVAWVRVEGTFVADGGEDWLTIGNFFTDAETTLDPDCPLATTVAYYYFDDVEVKHSHANGAPFTVDLGGPYTACNEVHLDAGVEDAMYFWSNGDYHQTTTVTTSGEYSVTVSRDCVVEVGTVEVTILGSPPVTLPPYHLLCDDETYTVSLDPDAGDYLWHDGSTEPFFTFTEEGTFSVELDDGCDITSASIYVQAVNSPPPFALGDDFYLCPGDTYVYSFDPTWGDFQWQNNANVSEYTIHTPGTYALTISNVCGESSDEVTVFPLALPVAQLGPDTIDFCVGGTYVLEVDPDMGDILWQDGSDNATFTVTSSGQYSVTISNACGEDTDEVFADQILPPEVELGDPVFLCPGEIHELNLEGAGTHFIWQDGNAGSSYEITTGGIYSVTVSNMCGAASDQLVVEQPPDIGPVNLGADISHCDGSPVMLYVNQPGADIVWSDNSQENSLLVTSSGTYYIEVSTDCESYSDTIEILIVHTTPELTLPADFSICTGQSAILDAGIPNVTYLWNDGSGASTLTVQTPGVYSLTISSECGMASDTVVIYDGGAPPSISLGSDTALCMQDTLLLYPVFEHVDHWIWSDSSNGAFYTITQAGTISLQAFNACGAAQDSIAITTIPGLPGFHLGNDTTVCTGHQVTFAVPIDDVSIVWFDGSTDSLLTVTAPMQVHATITNVCSTVSDTVQLLSWPALTPFNLGSDLSLCPGETITLTPEISYGDLLWQDGSTGMSYQVNMADTVILTVSNTCESYVDTLIIVESTEGPQVDLGPDQEACEGSVITLSAGISGVQYLWQDGSTDADLEVTASGDYAITVTNACGTDQDTVSVVISGLPPTAQLGPDTLICEGTSLFLYAYAIDGASIEWQDGSDNGYFEVEAPGMYWVALMNDCGAASDTIAVSMEDTLSSFSLGTDTALCSGEILILYSPHFTGILPIWQDGSATDSFIVRDPGLYSLSMSNNCGTVQDVIEVTETAPPVSPDLGRDTMLCPGTELVLWAPATLDSIEWQDGSSASNLVVGESGNYSLEVFNRCGQAYDTIEVWYYEEQLDVPADKTIAWCGGDTLSLDVTQPVQATYSWNTGATTPLIEIETSGEYAVTMQTYCQEAVVHFTVNERADCDTNSVETGSFFIPNIFSPNRDQLNDLFTLMHSPAIQIQLLEASVFDRWGNLVYSYSGNSFAWDGRFHGEDVPAGAYVYVIRVVYFQGEIRHTTLTGDVTLVR